MKAKIEFRIFEDEAQRYLLNEEGVCIDNKFRKIIADIDDPIVLKVGRIHQICRKKGKTFFYYWNIKRFYSKEELRNAQLFRLLFTAYFETVGEMCGTVYDESASCAHCGAYRVQKSDLILNVYKIPKKDIACSLGNEIVFSEKLKEIIYLYTLSGVDLKPVRHWKKTSTALPSYYQAIFVEPPVEVIPPARAGDNPFDDGSDTEFKCPLGHNLGRDFLTELYISKESWNGSDFLFTKQLVGYKRGVFRPFSEILISNRVYNLFTKNRISGFNVEIVHLV